MKVKDLKLLLETFDNDLEIYRQERLPSAPHHKLYIQCSFIKDDIKMQQNGGVIYLAIGDIIVDGEKGYCQADDSEIKYIKNQQQ